MTKSEFYQALASSGIATCYFEWKDTPPAMPWLCWLIVGTSPEAADNRATAEISDVRLELYTKTRDFTSEAIVDGILASLEIVPVKSEEWLEDTSCWLVTYEMDVLFEAEQQEGENNNG